jgi:hypothetical protein
MKHKPQFFFFGNLSEKHGGINKLILPLAKKSQETTDIRLVCRDADATDFPNLEEKSNVLILFHL